MSRAALLVAALALPIARPVSAFADEAVSVASVSPTIAAGESHSLVLKTDGSLWSFGNNGDGQLGRTSQSDSGPTLTQVMSGVSAVAAGRAHSLALKTDGSLWSFGHNGSGELGRITELFDFVANATPTQVMTGVRAIAAGGGHSLVLKD
jgi:alpha-tubulin suppressor-like RCC1 family protein